MPVAILLTHDGRRKALSDGADVSDAMESPTGHVHTIAMHKLPYLQSDHRATCTFR